jgi:DNA helicase-2/ATP-dependent DNA helicase PcrA
MNNLHLVLGPPGSGKTTRLLDIAEEEMTRVLPSEVAFVTFTKAGAEEAKLRAAARFGLDPDEDLPWYRTIHSLTYKQLGMSHDEVMDRTDWAKFAELIGYELSGRYDTEAPIAVGSTGDNMLRVIDYASTTMTSLEDAWHELGEAIAWHDLNQFYNALRLFKADTGKCDFSDMLHGYIRDGKPVPVKVAIIDEAQDLTAAQWAVVAHAFSNTERIYAAGDDDQAIYRWAGADIGKFLSLSTRPEVLAQSWRLPQVVFDISERVAHRISNRYVKRYAPTGEQGELHWHMDPDTVDLRHEGSWLLLARNNYMLGELERMARDLGMNYRRRDGLAVKPDDVVVMKLWEKINHGKVIDLSAQDVRHVNKALSLPKPALKELTRYTVADMKAQYGWPVGVVWYKALAGIPEERREYYINALRRGEKLTGLPRVRIETIHGVKGAEADNVLLLSDMSRKTWDGYHMDPDAEHRVFYVGLTRARKTLHIVRPQTNQFYPLEN